MLTYPAPTIKSVPRHQLDTSPLHAPAPHLQAVHLLDHDIVEQQADQDQRRQPG
jgi:hypothetical protein